MFIQSTNRWHIIETRHISNLIKIYLTIVISKSRWIWTSERLHFDNLEVVYCVACWILLLRKRHENWVLPLIEHLLLIGNPSVRSILLDRYFVCYGNKFESWYLNPDCNHLMNSSHLHFGDHLADNLLECFSLWRDKSYREFNRKYCITIIWFDEMSHYTLKITSS